MSCIKMHLGEISCEGEKWMELAQDRVQASVSEVLNIAAALLES
jgi:hypothetical protein